MSKFRCANRYAVIADWQIDSAISYRTARRLLHSPRLVSVLYYYSYIVLSRLDRDVCCARIANEFANIPNHCRNTKSRGTLRTDVTTVISVLFETENTDNYTSDSDSQTKSTCNALKRRESPDWRRTTRSMVKPVS